MPDMSTIDPEMIYAMLKGEPGTRKSTQALSFPTPQYWFSWDRKMQGIMVPMRKWGINPKLIQYDDYEDWNGARNKLEQFQLNCPFSTLVFDSLTSCADMTLRQTLKLKTGARKSGADAGRTIAGIAINEIEDYNAESSALNELIALTKDIQSYQKSQGKKVNIILIAHVMEVTKMVQNQQVLSRTIVTAGKRVAAKMPAYCTEVYHFGYEKGFIEGTPGNLVMYTHHSGIDFARTALDLPAKIEFGDKPIYTEFLTPAIAKLKGEIATQTTTQPTTPNNLSSFTR